MASVSYFEQGVDEGGVVGSVFAHHCHVIDKVLVVNVVRHQHRRQSLGPLHLDVVRVVRTWSKFQNTRVLARLFTDKVHSVGPFPINLDFFKLFACTRLEILKLHGVRTCLMLFCTCIVNFRILHCRGALLEIRQLR